MKQALLYVPFADGRVQCHLCGHHCVILQGERGVCQVRENRDGTLFTLVYGCAISQQVDPIEKKPLYHFLPGSKAFSVATAGCNMACKWCQNWQIAHPEPSTLERSRQNEVPPESLVAAASTSGCRSIAYTYTEPTIFFEYAFDTSKLAHEAGIRNVYVTNGYMTAEMLDLFHPYLDAANVDLKAFRQRTYARYTGAGLQTVLDSLRMMRTLGIWIEVTTLIVPGVNDDPDELREMAAFIAGELGKDTPWHLSRFFPHYEMPNTPPTPVETLQGAYEIGKEAGLNYVYLGNVPGDSDTHCPNCGQVVIGRSGYRVTVRNIQDSLCQSCETLIPGVWEM